MEKTLQQIVGVVERLSQGKKRIVIAIDGSCTAGKSTLAGQLENTWDCNVFHMDDFFLRPEQRTGARLAEPGGNVDYERFRAEVLEPLTAGKPVEYRPYDCSCGSLKPPVRVEPKAINIVEGTYSQHPYFADAYDLRIFLDVAPQVRKKRILARPAFLHRRFMEEWIPMEQAYFRAFDIAGKSHIVAVPGDSR